MNSGITQRPMMKEGVWGGDWWETFFFFLNSNMIILEKNNNVSWMLFEKE